MGTVVFGSDLDRAAYIIQSKAKKSKGEDRIIASLEAQGLDVAAVRRHGEKVKKAIGDVIEEQTGSRRAPQEAMEINVGSVPFDDGRLLSVKPIPPEGPDFLDKGNEYGLINRERFEESSRALADIIRRVAGKPNKLLFKSKLRKEVIPAAHGGDGKQMGVVSGEFNHTDDVMTIYGMLENDMFDIKDTAYHEAWHRLQSYFLTPKEMRVLNNAFSREKLKQYAGVVNYINNPASIEMQAFAFQNYARLRDFGWKDPARAARRSVLSTTAPDCLLLTTRGIRRQGRRFLPTINSTSYSSAPTLRP